MILEVCWDGLRTLSFGLSQYHGHGCWLVCEVALSIQDRTTRTVTQCPVPLRVSKTCTERENGGCHGFGLQDLTAVGSEMDGSDGHGG